MIRPVLHREGWAPSLSMRYSHSSRVRQTSKNVSMSASSKPEFPASYSSNASSRKASFPSVETRPLRTSSTILPSQSITSSSSSSGPPPSSLNLAMMGLAFHQYSISRPSSSPLVPLALRERLSHSNASRWASSPSRTRCRTSARRPFRSSDRIAFSSGDRPASSSSGRVVISHLSLRPAVVKPFSRSLRPPHLPPARRAARAPPRRRPSRGPCGTASPPSRGPEVRYSS